MRDLTAPRVHVVKLVRTGKMLGVRPKITSSVLHKRKVCVELSRGPCGPEPVCATCEAAVPHVMKKKVSIK